MKLLLLFFLTFSLNLVSQTKVLQIEQNEPCLVSNLVKLNLLDSALYVDKYYEQKTNYKKIQFENLKKHFHTETGTTYVLSDFMCVYLSSVSDKEDKGTIIKIYEVMFSCESKSQKVIEVVEKNNLSTLSWPDATLPICFYRIGKIVYVFLDSSDEPSKDNLLRISNKIIPLLNPK
jgi:hypothetical protein